MRPMRPEPPLFSCAYCGFLVPELQYVDASSLGIPVQDFCDVCATAVRHEVERTRAAWKSGRAK